MKKNITNRVIKIILIFIFLILILILTLINTLKNNKKTEIDKNMITDKNSELITDKNLIKYMNLEIWENQAEFEISEEEIKEAAKDLIIVGNMNEIRSVHKEEKHIALISSKVEDTIKNIFNTAVNNTNDLENFYNDNQEKILERLKIENYYQFQELINKIFSGESSKIIKAKIKSGSVHTIDNIIVAILEVTLENNSNVLLNLEISDSTSEIKIS